jgi:outer membrane protein TolC
MGRRLIKFGFFFLLTLVSVSAVEESSSQAFSLEQCINWALNRNPRVLKAQEEIKRTQGLLVEVRAQALPRLSVDYSLQKEDRNRFESSIGYIQQPTTWLIQFRARQAIYSGGQIEGAFKIARLTEDTALANLQTAVDETVLETRRAFYNVLLNRALITVSEQSVKLLQEELANQQRRQQAGTVTRFNVLRAEVELANARPNLIRAKNRLRISLSELAKIIAFDSPEAATDHLKYDVSGELKVEPDHYEYASSLDAAMKNRPELLTTRKQAQIQEAQLTIDRAGYFPSLDVFGGYDYIGSRSGEFGDSNDGYIMGVEGKWNLFDGLETKGKMDQTRARLRSALLDADDTRRQIQLEVRRAYSSLMEAREFLESQKKNTESATESLRLANARFGAGAGTQLDILTSQVALTQARTNELQGRYDYMIAVAELERAAGFATSYSASETQGGSQPGNAKVIPVAAATTPTSSIQLTPLTEAPEPKPVLPQASPATLPKKSSPPPETSESSSYQLLDPTGEHPASP